MRTASPTAKGSGKRGGFAPDDAGQVRDSRTPRCRRGVNARTSVCDPLPNGDYEYDVGRRAAPTIGDTVRRRGVLWSVTKITQDTVVTLHVERADAPAAQPVQSSVPREARSVSRQAE
jgi:hypothetical protein